MSADLETELEVAARLARLAGDHIRSLHKSGLTVERKVENEPVTRADREANQLIVDGLRSAFAEDGLLSEEAPDDGSRFVRPRVWMIDPLDGTQEFIRGEDNFATMIGLCIDGLPALGVVYQPIGERLYVARRGHGAWLSEGDAPPTRLQTSAHTHLPSLRLVASKSHRSHVLDLVRTQLGIVDELNIASVGLKLGLIARGLRDLYVNLSSRSKLWDTCGPEAILTEAGGRLTDLDGAPLAYRGLELSNRRGLVATNGAVHSAVLTELAPLLPRLL